MAKNTLPCSSLTKIIWLYTCQVIFSHLTAHQFFITVQCIPCTFECTQRGKKKPITTTGSTKLLLSVFFLFLWIESLTQEKKIWKKNFQLENKNLCWNDRKTRIKVWIKMNIFLTYTTDDLNMSVDIPVRIPFHKWKDLNTDRLWAPHQPFWARY